MSRTPRGADAPPSPSAPAFDCSFALALATGLGALLVLLPALRLAFPAQGLPDPLPSQHQKAETLGFVLAFAVVLPLAALFGHRLAARLTLAVGERAARSVAACLLAGLALVVLATRGAESAELGVSFVWLLGLAVAWWLSAVGALAWLLTRERSLRLLPPPRTAWAVTGLLATAAVLVFVDLGSLPLAPLAAGTIVAVATALLAGRIRIPQPARPWRTATDIGAIGLLVLAVTGVHVVSPEDPNALFETQIIQFHQDFYLGPANQIMHGGAMLVDTFSQYGVGAIYAIAAWFELVPIGNGTLGLLDGLLSGLVFTTAYGVLRLAGVSRLLAATALGVAVVALVYGLLYPVGALLQHGAIRFGMPIGILAAATLEARRPGAVPRVLQLVVLGISSIWALEAFAYTLLTLAAIVAVRVALAPSGERRAEVTGWLVGAAIACVAAHLLLVAITLVLVGVLPDWGRYIDILRAFLTGPIGKLTYDFAPWSPAFLVGALYFCSALALGLLIRLRPALAAVNRPAVIALAGSIAYGVALFSYFVNRSAEHILPYVCLPAVLVAALWLHLAKPAGVEPRARALAFGTAAFAATLMVATAWTGAGNRFSESAVAHLAPGGESLGGALDRLGEMPAIRPEASAGVRLLAEAMPGEERSIVLTDSDLSIEILWRADRISALPLSDPWEDSFVPEQHIEAVREAVAKLEAGDRMLIDKFGLDDYRGYLAEPDRDPVYDPFLEEGALVPIGLANLQQLALKEIGLRFRLRTVATADGLRVVELVPRRT